MNGKVKTVDKKVLFIAGAIFGVLILVVVVAMVIKATSGKNLSYESIESKLLEAAQEYVNDGEVDIPAEGTSITITDKELSKADYIKDLSEYTDDTCSGSVTVMNNNGLSLYLTDLQCKKYMTQHLATKIIDDNLVTEAIVDGTYQFGLYNVENEYIFKGKKVNNYVSFGGVVWRIIKIDSNGNLRLIKSSAEESKIPWDEKYNSEIDNNYGINDYANSFLLETLNNDYKGFNDENKKHLIPHSACIGSRGQKDTGISYDFDCSKTLDNQYISTLTTLDVAMASLDPGCKTVISGGCTNYNYMVGISAWTQNNYAENSHEVFTVGGIVGKRKASNTNKYYWVIYVSGNEPYKGGTGTAEDPYIIGE